MLEVMKAKYNHLPLKAYQVYELGQDWRGFSKEYSYGLFVGHTAGQARAQVAADRMSDGCANPWPWLRSRRILGPAAELAIEAHEDARKYWRDTRAFARLQAAADEFNSNWPVGTPVRVVGCGEADCFPDGVTLTRTPAWVPSLNGVLVSIEGYAGGFALKYIEPLVEPVVAAPPVAKGAAAPAAPTTQEGGAER